ncbi:ArsR/SmtB family transcription factor [Micromonospora sp. NPDC004336]
MSSNERIPDYDLDEMLVVTAPAQLRALADPLRATLLELVLERAATVTELARAVDRPKSSVAYHVNALVDAGLLRVVRTRRVRAIDERYYGRVARTYYIGALTRPEDKRVATGVNGLAEAVAESAAAHAADDLRCTLVHARIPVEEVRAFWAEVQALARRFAQIPRSGDQVYGFVAGLYPTDAPTLPEPGAEAEAEAKGETGARVQGETGAGAEGETGAGDEGEGESGAGDEGEGEGETRAGAGARPAE